MDKYKAQWALVRLSAAADRIEIAAMRPRSTDPELAADHERLRAQVGSALRQLDSLIGKLEE